MEQINICEKNENDEILYTITSLENVSFLPNIGKIKPCNLVRITIPGREKIFGKDYGENFEIFGKFLEALIIVPPYKADVKNMTFYFSEERQGEILKLFNPKNRVLISFT